MEAYSGNALYSLDAHAKRYPASLTKVMTLHLVFDAIDQGKISWDSKLKVSQNAANKPPSKVGLKAGSSIKLKDAVKIMVVKSANDVACVIAENLAGSEAAFARRMNNKAKTIGMYNTNFTNASGLPDTRQVTTAYDMAQLGRSIILRHPDKYYLFSTKEFTYAGRTFKNTNKLLGKYPGMDGMKTGYIRASGFNLLTSAKRNGARIIVVFIGGETSQSRNNMVTKYLDDGFDKIFKERFSWVKAPPSRPIFDPTYTNDSTQLAFLDNHQERNSQNTIDINAIELKSKNDVNNENNDIILAKQQNEVTAEINNADIDNNANSGSTFAYKILADDAAVLPHDSSSKQKYENILKEPGGYTAYLQAYSTESLANNAIEYLSTNYKIPQTTFSVVKLDIDGNILAFIPQINNISKETGEHICQQLKQEGIGCKIKETI